MLDLYERRFEGKLLQPGDYVISADEKTQLQALLRRHPLVAPGSRRAGLVEHEYRRAGRSRLVRLPSQAGEGNRTPISGLGSQHLGHWTTPAECPHPSGDRTAQRPAATTLLGVKRPLPIAVVVAAVALLALLGYGVINKGQDTTLDSAVAKGERPVAPDRTLPLVGEGATSRSLASYRGKVVVLNIWASWCIPCRDEAPVLQRTQERISSRGGTVLGVTYRDIEGRSQKFIREFGHHLPEPARRRGQAHARLRRDSGARDLRDRPQGPRRGAQPRHRLPALARRARQPRAGAVGVRRALAVILALAALGAAPARGRRLPARVAARHRGRGDVHDLRDAAEHLRVAVGRADERAFIRERIAACDTKAQIKDKLVVQYGEEVLALPKDRGFNRAVYLVPIVGRARRAGRARLRGAALAPAPRRG